VVSLGSGGGQGGGTAEDQVPPARIGVLALQGDFAAHARALALAGAEAREVRTPGDLEGLDGLILPGGESTALLRLLRPQRMDEAIRGFHRVGGALFGTCAGLILLAARVENPDQESLGLIDLTVERNSYGRQVDSFVGRGVLLLPGQAPSSSEMVFIRAPRIRKVGPRACVLGRLGQEPVLVQEGRILAATYHPEISDGNRVHPYFVALASRRLPEADSSRFSRSLPGTSPV
jgi:5'-phosphate synthase pdxT subunit